MSWIRLEDHFDEHPKLARAGALGLALWTVGLAYCNRNLTDGFIPWAVAQRLLNWEFLGRPEPDGGTKRYTIAARCGRASRAVDSAYVIGLLVEARLWEEGDGGYYVHDYAQYQPRREDVVGKREHLAAVRAQAGHQGALAACEARRAKRAAPQRQPGSKAEADGQQAGGKPAANEGARLGQEHGPNPNPNPNPNPEPNLEEALTLALSQREREAAALPSSTVQRSNVQTFDVTDNVQTFDGSENKARSPAQAAYLKAFGKSHFKTAAQAKALAQGEEEIGLQYLRAAIDWAAVKGTSDIQSILTAARKMEREGIGASSRGDRDGRTSRNGRHASKDAGDTRSPTDGDGWLDPKYKDL